MQEKIKTRKEISEVILRLKSEGKKTGFTSGVFDIVHAGHVNYLQKASEICDLLIVGINSDSSVRKYKGKYRPFINEQQRAYVIAGLESVDYVFIFSERRNRKNIEMLKPDYYIKAGDYKPDQLTSGKIVEKYEGEVRIIPVKEDISTSLIIDHISSSLGKKEEIVEKENTVWLKRRPQKQRPAVFFDRDGTINEEIQYLHDPEKFKFTKNAVEGILKIYQLGYRIVIITNQPGIGLGYFPEEDFFRVNRKMLKVISDAGILIDKIYFCPHSKAEKCSCRKPEQKLIKRAVKDLNIDLQNSWMIGDKTSDVEAGRRAGMSTMLVRSGYGGKDGEFDLKPDYFADDLKAAADLIQPFERD